MRRVAKALGKRIQINLVYRPVHNPRIEAIKARLAELELEKASLLKEMEDLSASRPSPDVLGVPASERPLSTPEERIALFVRLFRCREDVFPKMWENQKKGTRGYSPACASEWVRGVCDKPRIKCSACPEPRFCPLRRDDCPWPSGRKIHGRQLHYSRR